MRLYFVQRLKVDTYALTSLALREAGAYKKYWTLSTNTTNVHLQQFVKFSCVHCSLTLLKFMRVNFILLVVFCFYNLYYGQFC